MINVLFLVFFIVIFLNFFIKKEKNRNKIAFIFFLFITIIGCLRSYKVGTDTYFYFYDYSVIGITPITKLNNFRYELGFSLMCKMLYLIIKNPQTLIVFTSLITNFSIYHFIKKNVNDRLFSGICFFGLNYYFINYCLMRQSIALAILLIAVDALKDDKIVKFIVLVLIASLFHASSLLFLLVLIYRKLSIDNIIPTTIIFSILSFILAKPIFNLAANLIPSYTKYLTSIFIKSSYTSATLYTLSNFLIMIVSILFPGKNKVKNSSNLYKILIYINSLGSIISAASIQISIINRIYLTLGLFNIFLIPLSLEKIENKKTKDFLNFTYCIFLIMYVCIITKLGWFGVDLYTFYWEV